MEKRDLTMRDGKKIYTQIYDKGHKDFLLMIHGGPGEGCFNLQYQAVKLSKYINVVIFDQRGVLRSDKIEDTEAFGLEYLIDDCEDIKNVLGINEWSVLGHSFGGQIALLYAAKYPQSVKKVIFECPSFNLPKSMHSLYLKCADLVEKQGNYDYAKELKELVYSNNDLKPFIDNFDKIPGEIRSQVYNIGDLLEEVKNINSQIDATDEQFNNGAIHFERLQKEGRLNEDFMPLISELQCPSLLILGKYDSICCDEQKDYYLQNAINGRLVTLNNSGHTPHNYEPYKFTETVIDFLD